MRNTALDARPPTTPNASTTSAPELPQRLADALDTLALAVAQRMTSTKPGPRALHDRLQERLRLLGQLAAGLGCVPPELVPRDSAGYGSIVDAVDADTLEPVRYTIVSAQSIDFDADHVSLASPIGQALLGCQAGDVVTFDTPLRRRCLRVASVITLHDLLDVEALLRAVRHET